MMFGSPGGDPPPEAMDFGDVLRMSMEDDKRGINTEQVTGFACFVII